jgi:5,6-dimethylbenzimidazole synthase
VTCQEASWSPSSQGDQEEASGYDVSMCLDDYGHGLSAALTRERLSEAPLHLAVTYDCRRSGPIGLERNLAPSMDLYRTCCAIQHLWLAACAEGLGVVRIRLTDERAVARLLALPSGVQLITYLGLGIPQTLGVRPRRKTVDSCRQEHLGWHIYTDMWGGGHNA